MKFQYTGIYLQTYKNIKVTQNHNTITKLTPT